VKLSDVIYVVNCKYYKS